MISEAIVSALSGIVGGALGVIGGVWAATRSKEVELAREREAVQRALYAEIARVKKIVKAQLGFVRSEAPGTIRADAYQDPLTWMPIRIPVWDELRDKVGTLATDHLLEIVEFFGYVSWANELVALRQDLPNERLQHFGLQYLAALEHLDAMTVAT